MLEVQGWEGSSLLIMSLAGVPWLCRLPPKPLPLLPLGLCKHWAGKFPAVILHDPRIQESSNSFVLEEASRKLEEAFWKESSSKENQILRHSQYQDNATIHLVDLTVLKLTTNQGSVGVVKHQTGSLQCCGLVYSYMQWSFVMEDLQTSNRTCCSELQIYENKLNAVFKLKWSYLLHLQVR